MGISDELLRKAKLRLLKMHYDAKVGHIGGNLSALDIMLALHHGVMSKEDVFILSKGHSAGALYITLWTKKLISDTQLQTFHGEDTYLAGHPPPNWNNAIPFATGSLGHGASIACGLTLARRLQLQPGRVFCLLSDGEMDEGSTWEALHFASHHRLANLTFVLDQNGLQGFGNTDTVMNLGSMTKRLEGLDFDVTNVDGHSHKQIIDDCGMRTDRPKFVIAKTIKGNGVSFMEGEMSWHYLPMNESQYFQAVEEVSTDKYIFVPNSTENTLRDPL